MIPTQHYRDRAGPAEFVEICATYFGMPSPLASSLEGQGIFYNSGARQGTCDRFGLRLSCAKLDDRWTDSHDAVKDAIACALKDLDVKFGCEVHGVFA